MAPLAPERLRKAHSRPAVAGCRLYGVDPLLDWFLINRTPPVVPSIHISSPASPDLYVGSVASRSSTLDPSHAGYVPCGLPGIYR